MWWDKLWSFLLDKHIFHTLLVLVFIIVFIFPGRIRQTLGRFKKIKAGPLELDTGEDEIDPETPCPYTKSHGSVYKSLHDVNSKVDHLGNEFHKIMDLVQNLAIDQQKQLFYDTNQPPAERLAGGLKYVCLGGNGQSKKDIEKFAEEHKDIYNALTRVKPELRLIYER